MKEEKFYFGAASSSHQVEGGQYNDWTEWEARTGHERSGRAADHWYRYGEDFDIAKKLGHNAHRFSVERSRIERRKECSTRRRSRITCK